MYFLPFTGDVYSWGMAAELLGHGEVDEDALVPTKVTGKALEKVHVIGVGVGSYHTALLAKMK